MGFHMEEEAIADGTIDNRMRGRTLIRINFTNHTSSLVTLQGNPFRDLAGSLWDFKNPHAVMEDLPGEQCFFIPALCEGAVGRISHTRKSEVPILPPDEHYDRLYDPEQDDPPTRLAPILELEWFSQKYKQVEIDCELITLELKEMAWSLSAEEAADGERLVKQTRAEIEHDANDGSGFYEDMELVEEWLGDEPEPHDLEELCSIIVQEFIINSADDSAQKQALHSDLLKLQEQMNYTFVHFSHEGEFNDIPETIKLFGTLIPFIDRAAESAKFVAETTAEHLLQLRQGIINLRSELRDSK